MKTAVKDKPAEDKKSTAVATQAAAQLPAHLRVEGQGRGNENVTAQDLTIPRLGLLQGLSPQLEPGHAKFIPGATVGQMFNSLTNELYDVVYFSDVCFRKEYGVFVKRTAGGGFRGSFATEVEAVTAMETMEGKADLECIETGVHFCVMLEPKDPEQDFSDENQKAVGEFVLFFTVTKLKVSRNLNSLIRNRQQPSDRWAGAWLMTSVKETNKKGTFFNYSVAPFGWVSAEVNDICKATYEQVIAGNRKIDREGAVDDPDGSEIPANSKM